MPEANQGLDADPLDEDLGDTGGEGTSDKGDLGEGGALQTVKIGEKEYTPEQIAEIEKKASGYDALLPEFTRKSQKLSELEKDKPLQKEEEPFYHKEGWEPKDYGELQKAIVLAEKKGEERTLKILEAREQQASDAKAQVDGFVKEVKKLNKDFDESDFFKFVNRHELAVKTAEDLKGCYSVYQEVADAKTKGAEDAKKNINLRQKDIVAIKGGGKVGPFSVPQNEIRKSGSAYEAVMDAYNKLKK